MVASVRTFDTPGMYRACLEAEEFIRDEGYKVAHMEGRNPRGIAKRQPKRWSEMTEAERNQLAGILMGDFKHGPVQVWIDGEVR